MLFLRHVAAPALKKNRGRVKKFLCKKLPNPKCSMCRLARPYLRASFQWLSHIAETFMSSRRYRRHNIAQTARLFRRDYTAFVLASDKARRKKNVTNFRSIYLISYLPASEKYLLHKSTRYGTNRTVRVSAKPGTSPLQSDTQKHPAGNIPQKANPFAAIASQNQS